MIEIACNKFVLVLRDKTETETSGFYIPDQGRVKPHTATIQAIGPKAEDENIKGGKGKKCLFHPSVGYEIEYEGIVYLVLSDHEIIALP